MSLHTGAEPGQPLRAAPELRVLAGRGIEGDRYCAGADRPPQKHGPDREITLVEIEALEALRREYDVNLAAVETRRNVATRGVPLNHLVGRAFRVGGALLRGVRLCEPCGHLEKLTGQPKLREGLKHRGGLRAEVLDGGVIRVGDAAAPG